MRLDDFDFALPPRLIADHPCEPRDAARLLLIPASGRFQDRRITENGVVGPFAGETRLYILPGHQFRAIDMLLTNFHLPRSTLLMLVAALVGLERINTAYAHAMAAGCRFFSYDRAMLRVPAKRPFLHGHTSTRTIPA